MMHAYSLSGSVDNVSSTSTMSVSVSEDDSSFDNIVLAPPISEVQVKDKYKNSKKHQRHNNGSSPSGVTSVANSSDYYYAGSSNYSDITASLASSTILSPPRITRRAGVVEPMASPREEYGVVTTAHAAPSTSTVPTVVGIDDNDENVELIYMDAMSCLKRLHDCSTTTRGGRSSTRNSTQKCSNCHCNINSSYGCGGNNNNTVATAHTIEDDGSIEDDESLGGVDMNVIYYLESIPKMSFREMRSTLKEFNSSHGLLILILSLKKYQQCYRFVNATLHALFCLWDEYLTSKMNSSMELLFNKTETLRIVMDAARYHCYNNKRKRNVSRRVSRSYDDKEDDISEVSSYDGNTRTNDDIVDADADEIPCSAVNILCCMTFIGGSSQQGQEEDEDDDPTTEATSQECIDFVIEMMDYYPNAILLQKACVSYIYIITILNVPHDTTFIQHEHMYLLESKVDLLLLNAHRLYRETMLLKLSGSDGGIVDDTDIQCCQETLNRLLLSTSTTNISGAATATISSATTTTTTTSSHTPIATELSLD